MANARNARRAGGAKRRRAPRNTIHRIFRSKSGKTELGDFAVHLNPPPFPPSVSTQILQEKIVEVEKTFKLGVNAIAEVQVTQDDIRAALVQLLDGKDVSYTAVLESICYWCSSSDISSEMFEHITGKVQLRSGRLFRPARGGFEWPKNKRISIRDTSTTKINIVTFSFSSATAQSNVCVLIHVKVKVQPIAKVKPGPTLRFINLVQSLHTNRVPGNFCSPPLECDMARLSTASPHSFVALDDVCSESSCGVSRPHIHRGVRVVD
jgi:hypothetical protein